MFSGSQNCLNIKAKTAVPRTSKFLACRISLPQPCWSNIRHLDSYRTSAPTALASRATFPHLNFSPNIPAETSAREQLQLGHESRLPPEDSSDVSVTSAKDGHAVETVQTDEQLLLKRILDKRRLRQSELGKVQRLDCHFRRQWFPAPGSTSRPSHQEKRHLDAESATHRRLRWGEVLDLLADAVPHHKEAEGEELWVSKSALITLSGTSTSNSWVHQVRGGCQVQVTGKQSSSGSSRLVLLRGSTQSVVLTKKYFLLVIDEATQQPSGKGSTTNLALPSQMPPYLATTGCCKKLHARYLLESYALLYPTVDRGLFSTSTSVLQPLVRPVLSARKVNPVDRSSRFTPSPDLPIRPVLTTGKAHLAHDKHLLLPDDTLLMEACDVASFLRVVDDLTTSRIPRLIKRELFGRQHETFNQAIARALCHMFTDPGTARFASTAALNRALAFLSKHSELFHEIRLLYTQCRLLRLMLEPPSYSHVLCAAFARYEMQMFRQVLADLLFDGHRPDSIVWLALMKSDPSLGKKLSVASWMQRKRLLEDDSVKEHVVAEILNSEPNILGHCTPERDHFIVAMDTRFGRDWMSKKSVVRALRKCCDVEAWELALQIIDEAQTRNVSLNADDMATVLVSLQGKGSLRDCIHFLSSHQVQTVGRNNHILIPIVFMTAWQERFYNVCRVLWHYAASCGVITYKMQNVVTASLLRNQDRPSTGVGGSGNANEHSEWFRRAGKVIAGVHLDILDVRQFSRLNRTPQGSSSRNPMVWLAQYVLDDGRRDEQLSLAYLMLHQDLEAWKRYAVPSSRRLFQLLAAAYAKDVQWKKERIGRIGGIYSTQWMIENAIDLHLVKREISLNAKRCYIGHATSTTQN